MPFRLCLNKSLMTPLQAMEMKGIKILWADDEMEHLKAHVRFLRDRGYEVETVTSGLDVIEKARKAKYDLIFLDENMPGISGIEALNTIKSEQPEIPVVMITKNEEEHIMEEAIGHRIADFLIKPVNPNQMLLSIKKLFDNKKLVSQKAAQNYQQEFRQIGMALMDDLDFSGWKNIYRKLVHWALEFDKSRDTGMDEVLNAQFTEANRNFMTYIEKNFASFLKKPGPDTPVMSHNFMASHVLPQLNAQRPVFFILLDNLRYDQWRSLQPILANRYNIDADDLYMSILPTTTQYARNAIFAGLLPLEIEKRYPRWWSNDEDEGGKNLHEADFLNELQQRTKSPGKWSYHKITNLTGAKALSDTVYNLLPNALNVVVYNFVDALSHARTDVSLMRELSEDERAYRSLTRSWFEHSPLLEMLEKLADKDVCVIISTDHGSIRVKDPVKIVGDKHTNTNLRYKQGKSLSYNAKEVYEVKNPHELFLPKLHVSSSFVFAGESNFFAYPNNYNHYVNYYRGTIQHGGISMEEMLIPVTRLSPRR